MKKYFIEEQIYNKDQRVIEFELLEKPEESGYVGGVAIYEKSKMNQSDDREMLAWLAVHEPVGFPFLNEYDVNVGKVEDMYIISLGENIYKALLQEENFAKQQVINGIGPILDGTLENELPLDAYTELERDNLENGFVTEIELLMDVFSARFLGIERAEQGLRKIAKTLKEAEVEFGAEEYFEENIGNYLNRADLISNMTEDKVLNMQKFSKTLKNEKGEYIEMEANVLNIVISGELGDHFDILKEHAENFANKWDGLNPVEVSEDEVFLDINADCTSDRIPELERDMNWFMDYSKKAGLDCIAVGAFQPVSKQEIGNVFLCGKNERVRIVK